MSINEKQKWPTDKKKYDENWIRAFGIKCKRCKGSGWTAYEGEQFASHGAGDSNGGVGRRMLCSRTQSGGQACGG